MANLTNEFKVFIIIMFILFVGLIVCGYLAITTDSSEPDFNISIVKNNSSVIVSANYNPITEPNYDAIITTDDIPTLTPTPTPHNNSDDESVVVYLPDTISPTGGDFYVVT